MVYQLTQINIGRLVAPMAVHESQISSCNLRRSTRSPNHVWRFESSYGNAMDIAYSDHTSINVNMWLWESFEALGDYLYKSNHANVLRERHQWF